MNHHLVQVQGEFNGVSILFSTFLESRRFPLEIQGIPLLGSVPLPL